MSYQPGDRVILLDSTGINEAADTVDNDPMSFLFGPMPRVHKGMLGTVDEYTSEYAPPEAVYVKFDDVEDAIGVLPHEIELIEAAQAA